MSGSIETGEIVPYGEPATFAHRMKNRFGSNALLGPINGPHLSAVTDTHNNDKQTESFETRSAQEDREIREGEMRE